MVVLIAQCVELIFGPTKRRENLPNPHRIALQDYGTSRGPTVFTTLSPELFEPTLKLAANQGLYNAFLAVGLIWSLFIRDRVWQRRIAICFLGFVFAAGLMAALAIALRPGLFQMVPSALALIALLATSRQTPQRA